MKTPELVAEARRLRDKGLSWGRIGEVLGVACATAHAWVTDPDGSGLRVRKDSYAQPCVDCGAPTSGSEGRRKEPRCNPCASRKSGADRKVWTREAIILAIQEWAAECGEPPNAVDWWPWGARNKMHDPRRAERYEREPDRWPCVTSVCHEFGSWNAAIAAAGFTPRSAHGGDGNQLRRRRFRQSQGTQS